MQPLVYLPLLLSHCHCAVLLSCVSSTCLLSCLPSSAVGLAGERPGTGSIRRRDLEALAGEGLAVAIPPPAPILRTSTMLATTAKYGSVRGAAGASGLGVQRVASVDLRHEGEGGGRESSFLGGSKLRPGQVSDQSIALDPGLERERGMRGGRDGPTPPGSLRRINRATSRLSATSSNEGSPKPWGQPGNAPSARLSLQSDGSSEVLTVESSDESSVTDAGGGAGAGGAAKGKAGADPNDRSYFQKAEEMYSLQAAVALRLIADAEMAEETELVNPAAGATSDLMWAAPSLPRSQAEATAYRFWVRQPRGDEKDRELKDFCEALCSAFTASALVTNVVLAGRIVRALPLPSLPGERLPELRGPH